jgi:carbon catabolite-derepressing protein kinase
MSLASKEKPHRAAQRPSAGGHSPAAPSTSQATPSSPQFEDPSDNYHSGNASSPGKPKYIGNYEIIKTIGEGSFAKVKLAIHRLTGQKVCYNIIIAAIFLIRFGIQGRYKSD